MVAAVKIGPKEQRLAELRAKGQVPKHVEDMLAEGAPLATIALPGDPPRTNGSQPRDIPTTESAPETPRTTKPTTKAVDKSTTSTTSKPIKPAKAGSTSEDTMKTATAKKAAAKKTAAKSTERRKTKSTSARTPVKQSKPKQPKGFVVDILKMASRPNGASRAELIALTEWKGAPWKWLFQNSKGTGYCDRWGYKLKVIEGKDGETRYHVEKKA